MKQKEIFAMIFSLFPLLVFAQKDNSKGKPIPSKNKTEFIRNARVVNFSQLDQRKIYQWGNGQRSTPTGRQAGERTSGYALVYGDSAVVVPDPYRKKY